MPALHHSLWHTLVLGCAGSLLVTAMHIPFFFCFQVNMALAGKPLDVTLSTSRADQWTMGFPQKGEIITSLVSALDSMVRGWWRPHPPPSFRLPLMGLAGSRAEAGGLSSSSRSPPLLESPGNCRSWEIKILSHPDSHKDHKVSPS